MRRKFRRWMKSRIAWRALTRNCEGRSGKCRTRKIIDRIAGVMDAWPARWRLLPGFSQFHDLLATDRATFMIGEILSPRAAAFERIKRLVLATLPSADSKRAYGNALDDFFRWC